MGSSLACQYCESDEGATGSNTLSFSSSTKPDGLVDTTDWPSGDDRARSDGHESARDQIKAFVVSMVRGRNLPVLSLNGGQVDCRVSFDKKLNKMSLQRDTSKRDVPLDQICGVCIGKGIDEDVDLPVHDLCVTLLTEEQAVSLCFENEVDRDEFGECMSTLLAGRQKSLKKASSPRKKTPRQKTTSHKPVA
mmetsp:Transcript_131787/g.256675  ORF Transcript_131787/g.256675 Transcript_131787/m.256675 type:complete len:192 (-) Transcript_131787:133-708(-)